MVIKMDEYIFKDIKRLETPVGYFSITDGKKEMPFSVKENAYSVNIYGENDEVLREVIADTCYAVEIKTSDYEIGKIYKYSFSEQLVEVDWDDAQYSRYDTIKNYVVGIGMFNPNEWDELDQCYEYSNKMGIKNEILEPPSYNEKIFKKYSMRYSDDKKGFYFKLLDRSSDKIYFEASWIKIGEFSKDDCETAIIMWTT